MKNLPDYDLSNSHAACCFRIRQCETKAVYDFNASALSPTTLFANSLKNAGTTGSKDSVTNAFERVLPSLPAGEYHLINYYAAASAVTVASAPDNVFTIRILENGQVLVGSEEIAASKTRMN
jgi:hypothetical protein